jgi:hypothetical protein
MGERRAAGGTDPQSGNRFSGGGTCGRRGSAAKEYDNISLASTARLTSVLVCTLPRKEKANGHAAAAAASSTAERGRLPGSERIYRSSRVRGAPGVRQLLGRDRRRQRQLFLCASQEPSNSLAVASPTSLTKQPHRALGLIGCSLAKHLHSFARRVLLNPFVPGGQPFDNRAPRGEDLQWVCGLRPRQRDVRVPAHRLHSDSPPFEPRTRLSSPHPHPYPHPHPHPNPNRRSALIC